MTPGATLAPHRGRGWARECSAGAAGALAALAPVLTLGLLAYAALGPAAAAVGIPAAFIATVIGGSLFVLLSRGPMPASGPSSAPVLMLAGLVLGVAADPAFSAARPADLALLLALAAAAVVAMGVLQIAFALAGFVRAAQFVPQPVLAGFMNGVAVVFMASQLPLLFGWPAGAWSADGWQALGHIEPATLGVGLVTIAAIALAPRIGRAIRPLRRIPATLVGLLVGGAAYAAVAALWPQAPLGELAGRVPSVWPWPTALLPLADALRAGGDMAGLLHRHAGAALATAVLMALIGTLDIVLNGLALDQALQTRTDPRRELLALGAANIASGVFGGLPLLLLRARALATHHAGGRTRLSLLAGNALFALLAVVGGPLLAVLPKVVLAAIMVTIGMLLFDAWSLRLAVQWLRGQRSAEARLNLALVAVVAGVSVAFGFTIGVAVGAVLAVAVFIRGMNRSLVRSRHTAAAQPSRRIHAAPHEALLQGLRPRIAILELEGALFFGSADRLAREADAPGESGAALIAVILDFRRVSLIDASGAVVLAQIAERLRERRIALLLAGVSAHDRHGRALIEFAGPALAPEHWHADVDRAVEAAELKALADAGATAVDEAVPLARSSLLAGFDEAQCALLLPYLERRKLEAGERLFAQGDPGDGLYVLTAGSISVLGGELAPMPEAMPHGPRQRFVTGSPGMMLGEIALLDGGGRGADAVADTASEVFRLSRAALERLGAEQPALCGMVYRNIALHLATRLRIATAIAQNASR